MSRLAFGIMSAREPATAVSQLSQALLADVRSGRAARGDIRVFLHHDLHVQPDFRLDPEFGAEMLPDPERTGWGTAGFCRAIFRTIRHALEHSEFEYFQLLSGSCLPIKPIADFRRKLSDGQIALCIDAMSLDQDGDALLSHGHRVYGPAASLTAKLLRKARMLYFRGETQHEHRASLGVLLQNARGWPQKVGLNVHQAARLGLLGPNPYRPDFRPHVGSTWFCLRRDVCEWLVRQQYEHPAIDFLMSLGECDEIVFPTLLMNHEPCRVSGALAESHHLVNFFDDRHPRRFSIDDLQRLRDSTRFFARKFELATDDPLRTAVIRQLVVREPIEAC